MPKCTIVVFCGHTLLGEQGQLINPPVNGGPFKTQEEAAQAAFDAGFDWFEKNVAAIRNHSKQPIRLGRLDGVMYVMAGLLKSP